MFLSDHKATSLLSFGLVICIRAKKALIYHVGLLKFAVLDVFINSLILDF